MCKCCETLSLAVLIGRGLDHSLVKGKSVETLWFFQYPFSNLFVQFSGRNKLESKIYAVRFFNRTAVFAIRDYLLLFIFQGQ